MEIVALVVVLLILGIFVAYVASLYNRLVFLKNQCDRAWSNIDVLLKQRHDEIPKLIKVCEGYMQYEKDTLERVVKARAAAVSARDTGERIKSEGELSNALSRLFALAENYPELKAQQMFMQLQGRISQLESEIADRREFYNSATTNYNIATETLPMNFVANAAGYRQRELFRATEADRQDVEINIKTP